MSCCIFFRDNIDFFKKKVFLFWKISFHAFCFIIILILHLSWSAHCSLLPLLLLCLDGVPCGLFHLSRSPWYNCTGWPGVKKQLTHLSQRALWVMFWCWYHCHGDTHCIFIHANIIIILHHHKHSLTLICMYNNGNDRLLHYHHHHCQCPHLHPCLCHHDDHRLFLLLIIIAYVIVYILSSAVTVTVNNCQCGC